MKAAVVKINYELIDEIIREAFSVGLMPETDRTLYYKINLSGGNAGLYAFAATVYAETIQATKDFNKKCNGAESAEELIKNISDYEDYAFARADRRSMLRIIGEHIAYRPINGLPKEKYVAAIDFFGETEEALRCTAIIITQDPEKLEGVRFDLCEADKISDFSVGGFNGFDNVTALKIKK